MALAAAILSALGLGLGAFSIRPFTKLYLPWILARQWTRVHFQSPPNPACFEEMKLRGMKYEPLTLGPQHTGMGCALDTGVRVFSGIFTNLNVSVDPQMPTLSGTCAMALRIEQFNSDVVVPLAQKYFQAKPTVFHNKGGYSCRAQRTFFSVMSEHAFGEAFDIGGYVFEDGRKIDVETDYGKTTPAGDFFKELAAAACRSFGTVLGPPYDEAHKDHLHVSIGFPRLCVY